MAGQSDPIGGPSGISNEVRTHFTTREGVYKLMTLAEYSRPNRGLSGYNPIQSVQQGGGSGGGSGQGSNPPVRVTLISLPSDPLGFPDRICFNHGRELYFYTYKGARKPADLSKPIDKRIYKGTSPTCHDINRLSLSNESVLLLVGFTGGQIQLVDPIRKEIGKLYNEERIIEKTRVTCIKWIPGSPNLFLVSHASGQMYLYNEEAPCGGPTPPSYQLFKQGSGFSVWTCKAKSTRNPIYRWVVGEAGTAVNEFAFSPCSKYLAVVSQDGCLRVLNYDAMDLVGLATSFFGGLLCVSWSPDGQLVVAGGEDDLVTVWSLSQRRVVARGHGHRSWVTVVAFDPFTTIFSESSAESPEGTANCYRLGSVSMDTQLCLWELTDDVLKQPYGSRSRASVAVSSTGPGSPPSSLKGSGQPAVPPVVPAATPSTPNSAGAGGSLTQRLTNSLTFAGEGGGSLAGRSSGARKNLRSSGVTSSSAEGGGPDRLRLMGTPSCPRLDEVPMLEPLVCKKIAAERLTSLIFREDCIITACQDGIVCTWARPEGSTSQAGSEGTMV